MTPRACHHDLPIGWWGVSLLLGIPSLLCPLVPLSQAPEHWPAHMTALALQPAAGVHNTGWAWWTTVWLHGSPQHQTHNLLALLLLAALGTVARPGWRGALAWWLAWPLTQIGLLLQTPPVAWYVGLSGVLHAGAGIVAIHLLRPPRTGSTSSPLLGWGLLLGLLAKVTLEQPWLTAVSWSAPANIPVVSWAHLSGTLSGVICGLLLMEHTSPPPIIETRSTNRPPI